jgi:hypothetical protein
MEMTYMIFLGRKSLGLFFYKNAYIGIFLGLVVIKLFLKM